MRIEKNAIACKPALRALLKQLRVRVQNPDNDTLLLLNVPADCRVFSKSKTNVLVKRPRPGLPFLLCVDEDLDYVGPDREMVRAFATADLQQGWRVVSMGVVYHHAEEAVQQALAMLGVSGEAVAPGQGKPADFVTRFAVNISAQTRDGTAPGTVGRDEAAEHAATSLLSRQRRMPLIAGAAGLGKTNFLYKVAREIATIRPAWELVSVDVSCLLAGALWEGEREKLLTTALEEAVAREALVLVFERLELALAAVPLSPWMLAAALDRGARLAATCEPSLVERLVDGPLARRMDVIEVRELARDDAAAALAQLRETLAAHHGVAIDEPVVAAALERSLTLSGRLPDKAITLLDAACSRAALLQQPAVTLCDLFLAASRMRDA